MPTTQKTKCWLPLVRIEEIPNFKDNASAVFVVNCPDRDTYCIGEQVTITSNISNTEFLFVSDWGDGTNGIGANGASLSHTFNAAGTYAFTVQVKESQGGPDPTIHVQDCVVTIVDCSQPLSADVSCPDNNELCKNVPYTFNVIASGGTAPYTYQATFPAGGMATNTTGMFTWTGLNAGPKIFTAVVTDSDNNSVTVQCQFDVIECETECTQCETPECTQNQHRVFVSADPFTVSAEKDDEQLLYILSLYSDILDIRGISVNNLNGGASTGLSQVQKTKDLLANVGTSKINSNCDKSLMTEAQLQNIVYQGGDFTPGGNASTTPSAINGSQGATRLKQEILQACADGVQLWYLSWGPPVDIAQALFELNQSPNPSDREAYKCVCLFTIGSYNTAVAGVGAYQYLTSFLVNNRDLFWIDNASINVYGTPNPNTFAGIFTGVCASSPQPSVMLQQIKAVVPTFPDAYADVNNPTIPILKIGDAATILYLLSACMSGGTVGADVKTPTIPNYGGQYRNHNLNGPTPNYYVDISVSGTVSQNTICRWRTEIYENILCRFRWCIE